MLVKFFILFTFYAEIFSETIFSLDLSDGGYANQFTNFQEAGAFAEDGTDSATSDPVITFSKLTNYSGIILKDWIESSNQIFYISILFKGDAGKRTGGYMGYMRSDQENIQRTIGLDQNNFMDVSQFYSFETGQGEWTRYQAYLEMPVGVKIKLILEQGTYFGLTQKYYAAFKDLKVTDDKWEDECPGTDSSNKQSYFTSLFDGMDLANKVWTTMSVENADKGKLTFNYIDFKAPCVIPQFYILDKDKAVVDTFTLSDSKDLDLNYYQVKTWQYAFTLSQIENANCIKSDLACVHSGIEETCANYTCYSNFHFYYDLGDTTKFNTLAEEFEYSSKNSQAQYDGKFSVIVFKENSTVLNTVVYTKVMDNTLCTGKCTMNMELTLGLKIKMSSNGEWETPGTTSKQVVWGDKIYIKISSTPSTGYKLGIMEIYATTEDGQNIALGQLYIDSFLENAVDSVQGEITFEMKISGEAGTIDKGKKYNLLFLVKTTAISGSRLLGDNSELPLAQSTSDFSIQVVKLGERLYLGISFILLMLLLQSLL